MIGDIFNACLKYFEIYSQIIMCFRHVRRYLQSLLIILFSQLDFASTAVDHTQIYKSCKI